ncbi:hypothetical protein FGO68_gene13661 [Halteria grandinella]|uniref:Uncharacterized protein n=1 Tax=Halteria grandinella TaxID=5974 RepID=A0A8J8NPI8_HALGN|nr:hypothetical protein FGO68_gene13661 [Halteria grandinella]
MKQAKKPAAVTQQVVQDEETQVTQGDNDLEYEPAYNEIDKLEQFGINQADIAKLKTSGICTVLAVLMCTKKEMLNIKGITEQKAEKIYEAASKIETMSFQSGMAIFEKRKKIRRITTGSRQFDMLLQGGVESQGITEAFGEFRTGKTQLAHTLCVTAQLPKSSGGGEGKVLYIDTENTFRPERIKQISQRYNLDPEQVLNNIMVGRAFTVDAVGNLIMQAAAAMIEDQFSLMVIDSIMAPYRVDYSGRGELAERQQVLGRMLSKIQKISEQFNIAIFMTNQVMADPGGGMTYAVDPKKPVGGNIMAHASTTRLFLRKGKGEQRVCKIFDSPSIPEGECVFQISEGGIIDATD